MAGGIGGLPSFGPGDALTAVALEVPRGGSMPAVASTRRPAAAPSARRPLAERPRERLAQRGAGRPHRGRIDRPALGERDPRPVGGRPRGRRPGPPRRTDRPRSGDGAGAGGSSMGSGPLGRRSSSPPSSSAGACWPTGRPGAGRSAGPHDVADRLILQMGRLEREELRVVMLDTKNHVLRVADGLPGQRLVIAGAGRRAVPRCRPAQRRGRDPGPQPPIGRPHARHPTTCT